MSPHVRLSAPDLESLRALEAALATFRTELVEESGAWSLSIRQDREFNLLLLGVIDRASTLLRERELGRVVLHVGEREYGLPDPRPAA